VSKESMVEPSRATRVEGGDVLVQDHASGLLADRSLELKFEIAATVGRAIICRAIRDGFTENFNVGGPGVPQRRMNDTTPNRQVGVNLTVDGLCRTVGRLASVFAGVVLLQAVNRDSVQHTTLLEEVNLTFGAPGRIRNQGTDIVRRWWPKPQRPKRARMMEQAVDHQWHSRTEHVTGLNTAAMDPSADVEGDGRH
jgi:hypothetical protein